MPGEQANLRDHIPASASLSFMNVGSGRSRPVAAEATSWIDARRTGSYCTLAMNWHVSHGFSGVTQYHGSYGGGIADKGAENRRSLSFYLIRSSAISTSSPMAGGCSSITIVAAPVGRREEIRHIFDRDISARAGISLTTSARKEAAASLERRHRR